MNGGFEGISVIKKVIYRSNALLKRNGLLAIEIGFGQYEKVSKMLRDNGFGQISKLYDYNRNVRCIISTKIRFF